MALRLRIVSEHRRTLGRRSSIVFGVAGGSIGRSADNDWVLPDPSRFLSGRHARVLFRHGLYMLEDTSTNGTYLNDAQDPIPKQTPCELHNGDILRIGEYEVVVAIDQSAEHTAERTVGLDVEQSGAVAGPAVVSTDISPQIEGNLDISLTPSALFNVDGEGQNGGLQIGNAFGQAVVVPFGNSRPAAPPPQSRRAENSDIIAARRMERLKRSVAGANRETRDTQPVDPAMRAAFDAFCRGAGIEASALPVESAAAMLQLAGRLLREALVGVKDLDGKQSEMRRNFGLPAARPGDEHTPFQVTAAADDLLVRLLASHDSRRLEAGQWLRQVFQQNKQHQEAVARAIPESLRGFMKELDPRELEERFERSATRNLMGGRPNNWELYSEIYRTLVEAQTDSGLPHNFAESFAAAYSAEELEEK